MVKSLGFMNNFAVKMYNEVKVLFHAFFTLAVVGGEWLALCAGHFTPKEGPQCPFYRGLDGFQSQSGHRGEEKNLLIVPGMEVQFLGLSAITLVSCGELGIPLYKFKRQQMLSASKIE
jgi:hypothetical protein